MHPDETAAPPPPAPDASSANTPTPTLDATPAAAVDKGAAAAATPAECGLSPAECGARLATLFPALFVAPGAPGPFKPIKLRIHADILARAPGMFSKRVLGIFFSRYTTSNAYLKALTAPGAQRFDLDGQPAGEIAEEHRAAAAEELARRHAIAAERRAVQPPRRAAPPQRDPTLPAAAPTDDTAAASRPHAPRPQNPQHSERPRREQREAQRDTRPPARGGPQRAAARPERPPRRDPAAARAPSSPALALPADPAQRERALLLRAFESSSLSKANFCVLKRISETELDAILEEARSQR